MPFELKFKGIATRWFVNIFIIVTVVISAAAVALAAIVSSLYIERVQVLANNYAREFASLSETDMDNFANSAISLAEGFQYKDKIEIQVYDSEDNLIVSTTGFQSKNGLMLDYSKANESGTSAVLRGETFDGEPIIAGTTLLYDSNGTRLGAYRWITSLELVNVMMRNFIIVIAVGALVVLAFFALSGMFFINSIVRPIRDVSNMARKIAMGNFESRIEYKKNDEIGELCDTINYMAGELTQAENLKNDFISSVSHELRTPLTAIRGWGETAKMSVGYDDSLVDRGLDVVLSEADRLSGLVEELLDFSRMQNGKMVMTNEILNISKLLYESVNMYEEIAKKQEIDLVFTEPGEEIQVFGDRNRLKQVFINIIDNAIKYTENGGQVLVSQFKEDGCVRIVIVDTGVGIPAQDIDRVKEKFYKANKVVRGSGIGLAVADEIVKQHQGLLFLESVEGAGTTVTIVLPLYEENNGDNAAKEV